MQGDLNNSIANIFRKLGHVKIWTYIWVIRVCLYRILLMESSEHIVIENADVLCVLKVFYKTQAFLTSFMATVITGVYFFLKKKTYLFFIIWWFHTNMCEVFIIFPPYYHVSFPYPLPLKPLFFRKESPPTSISCVSHPLSLNVVA